MWCSRGEAPTGVVDADAGKGKGDADGVPNGDSAKANAADRYCAAEAPLELCALTPPVAMAPLAAEPGKQLAEKNAAGDERASNSPSIECKRARSWFRAASRLRVAALAVLLLLAPPLPMAPLMLATEPLPGRAAVKADAEERCGESISASPTRAPPPEIGRKLCGLPSDADDALALP